MPLPSWLTDPNAFGLAKLPAASLEEKNQSYQRSGIRASARTSLRANVKFLEDLNSCNDLSDLHSWAAKYDIDLRRHSRMAFRRLSESGQTFETLCEASGDNTLNNSDNLDLLLRQWTKEPLTVEDSRKIGFWMQQTLLLGQWSEAQIDLILDFVLHISTVTRDGQAKCNLIGGVFRGLKSSTVFNLKELKYSQVGILLKAATCGTFTRLSQHLGFHLLKALEPAQSRRLVNIISLFIQRGIEAQVSWELKDYNDAIPRSFEMLYDLPRRTSYAVIIEVSRALVKVVACLPESNIPLLKLLDQWWYRIRYSDMMNAADEGANRRQLERILTGKSMVIVATYLRHLDDYAIAHFILRREFLTHLGLGHRSYALVQFRQICDHEADTSPFAAMIRVAYDYDTVSERLMLRVFRLLVMLQKSKSVANMIVELRVANIRIGESVILQTIKTGLHWKYHRLDQIFAVYRELPLEKCPELAERMIKNGSYHPSEALKRYIRRHPGVIPGCREPLKTIKARSELLQRMALAYANARHLTPRAAFFFAYKCYIYHATERLGHWGKERMILALTRSAVIRPLECGRWVSSMRLRWLLEVIRKSEGAQVASQVDKAVFAWRGMVVKKIQADYHRRKRARRGRREPAMSFRFSSRWVKGRGYADRVLEPLQRRRP